jgi:aryl-alcohol dehydrogenase-like predicted oxidoreductase
MSQEISGVSRREFVKTGGAVLGSLAVTGTAAPAVRADDRKESDAIRVPQVVLGRTGATVGQLGIGCAYFQRARVKPDDVAKTLHRALELGVNYLDTAPNYGNPETGFAEEKMGPVMPEIRDKVFLVTKTEDSTYDGTWKLLRQSMKRLHTDRIDLVHLHNFGMQEWWADPKLAFGDKGAMAALREAKKQGVIRFIGASGHVHPARFHTALDSGEIDVLMNAVNFVTRHTYDFEHKIWSRAHAANIGLVAMKVLGGASNQERGGFLLPEDRYEAAIRYALSVPGISVAVIGMETIAEVEKAARTVANAQPLSAKEALEIARLGLEMSARKEWQAPYGTPLT